MKRRAYKVLSTRRDVTRNRLITLPTRLRAMHVLCTNPRHVGTILDNAHRLGLDRDSTVRSKDDDPRLYDNSIVLLHPAAVHASRAMMQTIRRVLKSKGVEHIFVLAYPLDRKMCAADIHETTSSWWQATTQSLYQVRHHAFLVEPLMDAAVEEVCLRHGDALGTDPGGR